MCSIGILLPHQYTTQRYCKRLIDNFKIHSPKPTMITQSYACPKPNAMMVKLKNTLITIMAMLCSRRLQRCCKTRKVSDNMKINLIFIKIINKMHTRY